MTDKIHIVALIDDSGSMREAYGAQDKGFSDMLEKIYAHPLNDNIKMTMWRYGDPLKLDTAIYSIADIRQYYSCNRLNANMPGKNTFVYRAMRDSIINSKSSFGTYAYTKTIFFHITDGAMPDQDKNYIPEIAKLVKDNYLWDFILIGANLDTKKVGSGLGISPGASADFTYKGCKEAYDCTTNVILRILDNIQRGDLGYVPAFMENERKLMMGEGIKENHAPALSLGSMSTLSALMAIY